MPQGLKAEDGNLINTGLIGMGVAGQHSLSVPDREANLALSEHQGVLFSTLNFLICSTSGTIES